MRGGIRRAASGAAAGLVAVVGSAAAPVGAEPARDPEFSLSVSPTRIVVPAGAPTHEVTVTVINGGGQPVDVVVRRQEMQTAPDGSVSFPAEAPYSATHWVSATPDRLRLAADQAREVAVQVRLPDRYEPGDHHVALVFMVPAADGPASIRINRAVGIPMYVQAPGPVDRSVELTSFDAPGFATGGPITFTSELRHTGTVHRDFRGDARLGIEVAGGTVPLPEITVLREATREVVAQWKHPPLMCVCRATLALAQPDGGVQRRSVTVVVVPVRLAGAIVAVAVALAVGLVLVRRRRVTRR